MGTAAIGCRAMQGGVQAGPTGQVTPHQMAARPRSHYLKPERDKTPVESFKRDQLLLRENLSTLWHQATDELGRRSCSASFQNKINAHQPPFPHSLFS